MALTIAEEFLLVERDQRGRELCGRIERTRGVAGALLIGLVLDGLLAVDGGRLVAAAAEAVTVQPQAAALLERVRAERRPRRVKWWVRKAESGAVNRHLLSGLVAQGILAERHDRVLGIVPTTRWAEHTPQQREEIHQRLTSAVKAGSADDRTRALTGLLDACGLSRKLFPAVERPVRKARMRELAQDGWTSGAVRDAVVSIQAATAAAIGAAKAAAAS